MLNMELNVYVANLGKYNEGFLVGEWFTLPVDFDEVAKKIGLNEEYEEYAIHDYEAPFKIGEYTSLASLNDIAERINSLADYEHDDLELLLETGELTFDEAMDVLENCTYTIYTDCKDMGEVAYQWYDETGMINEIPSSIVNYIDWDSIGRDMEMDGSFYYVGNSTYVELHH